jgi:hypothetical protein
MKTTELELAAPASSRAVDRPQAGLSLESAYKAVVDGNLDAEKLAVLKDLLAMNAQRQFAIAFNELQRDMPILTATTVIPNRGKYLRFEDMMREIGPILSKHGFSVSFDQDWREGRAVVTIHLLHIGGHKEKTSYAVRSGGRSDSETQADQKASTTAKRNALCLALNVTIQQDCLNEENDAGLEGDPNAKVTPTTADELERRVKMTNSSVTAFLKFCRADSFANIPANKYDEADAMLRRKEQVGR